MIWNLKHKNNNFIAKFWLLKILRFRSFWRKKGFKNTYYLRVAAKKYFFNGRGFPVIGRGGALGQSFADISTNKRGHFLLIPLYAWYNLYMKVVWSSYIMRRGGRWSRWWWSWGLYWRGRWLKMTGRCVNSGNLVRLSPPQHLKQ